MNATTAHALDNRFVRHIDFQHVIDSDAGFFHRIGLRHRPWETIEQIAVGAIHMLQAILDQADDDVVGYQAASVHHFLRFHTQRRACLDCRAQHIARGDLRDIEFLFDEGGLRALSGTGRS